MAVSFLDEILVKLNGTSSSKKYLQLNGGGASGSVSGQAGIGFRPLNAGSNVHASIEGLENGNGSYQTHLTFSTNGSSSDSAPSERMRITSAGNVGIGTTAPGSVLHVKGGSVTTPANASAFITNATSRFVVNHSNEYGSYIGYANTSNDAIAIQSARSNGTTGVLSLNPYGGNVGIGTTSPGYKLDLNGDVRGNSFWFRANTASAPSATGGFYRPTLGAVAYGYNASELFRITSGGNVGIGTTAPNRLLTVQTTGSGSYLALNSSSNNTTIGSDVFGSFVVYDDSSATYRMVIDQTTGNVGIGTSSPAATLDISHTDPIPLRLSRSTTGQTAIRLTNGSANNLDLTNDGSGNFTIGNGGSERMRIDPSGNVGIGTTAPGAKLDVQGGGVTPIIANSTQDYLIGLYRNSAAEWFLKAYTNGDFALHENGLGDRFTIKAGGNVGIGTSSPVEKLHVNSTNEGDSYFYGSTGNLRGMRFSTFATASAHAGHKIDASSGNGEIALATGGTEAMRIASNSNIGIGTTTPLVSLDLGFKTDAVSLPVGDDAARPSTPVPGMIRYNTSASEFEGYSGILNVSGSWGALGGGGGGASTITTNNFPGNGTVGPFTLGATPSGGSTSFVDVFIDGVYQEISTYTVSGTALSFVTGSEPPTGTNIQTKTTSGNVSGALVSSVDIGQSSGNTGAVNLRIAPIEVTSGQTISGNANSLYIFTATAGGSIATVTLPGSPTLGDSIKISNLGGLANVLGANGNKIMGVAADLTINTPTAAFEIIWSGSNNGWIIIGNV